jgi:hypothetical protein
MTWVENLLLLVGIERNQQENYEIVRLTWPFLSIKTYWKLYVLWIVYISHVYVVTKYASNCNLLQQVNSEDSMALIINKFE